MMLLAKVYYRIEPILPASTATTVMLSSRPVTAITTPRLFHSSTQATLSSSLMAAQSIDPGKNSAQTKDSRVGTVAQHRYHLVVCNSSSKEWPSKVETMSESITALARGSIRLPGKAMVTLSDFAPLKNSSTACCCASSSSDSSSKSEHLLEPAKSKYERIDVAVFPLGIVAKQIDVEGANRLLQWLSNDVLPTSWSTSHTGLPQPPFEHAWLELTRNRHIFVCTHGSRDYLCGAHGGKLLEELRSLIEKRGLSKHVAAWSTSHIGGHKYAANAIVYPRGDWYGTWCDRCRGSSGPSLNPEADANAIIDSAINDLVWWDAWRGAINMSKNDQINAFAKNNSGSHADVTGQSEDKASTAWVPGTLRKRSAGGS